MQERRRAILRAAADAFRAKGYQATGMRDIARRAGLSAANLYYYFESKHELLYFCQDRALVRMLALVDEASQRDASAPERLRAVIAGQLRIMLGELDGAAAHVELDALPARRRRAIVAKRDRYERAVRAIVREGLDAGSFRGPRTTDGAPALDPEIGATLATRAILGALNGTPRWFRPDGPLPVDTVAAAYADTLVRGLLP